MIFGFGISINEILHNSEEKPVGSPIYPPPCYVSAAILLLKCRQLLGWFFNEPDYSYEMKGPRNRFQLMGSNFLNIQTCLEF